MKKEYLIAIASAAALLILSGVGYWYWQSGKVEPEQPAAKVEEEIIPETVNEEITLPDSIKPLESKPDINPADQANPYKNIKTNPFE